MSDRAQREELNAAFFFGFFIAFAINLAIVFVLGVEGGIVDSNFPRLANLFILVFTLLPLLVQVIAELHQQLKINRWFALPFGVLFGTLIGVFSMFLLLFYFLTIEIYGKPDLWRSSLNVIEAIKATDFWRSISWWFFFGALSGSIPTAIGSLALSIWRHLRVKREVATTLGMSTDYVQYFGRQHE